MIHAIAFALFALSMLGIVVATYRASGRSPEGSATSAGHPRRDPASEPGGD